MKPRVLLVDALSLGLAPIVRDELLRILRRIADEGTGIIVVEQSVRAVLEGADRAYLLRRGEMVDYRPTSQWKGRFDTLAEWYLS